MTQRSSDLVAIAAATFVMLLALVVPSTPEAVRIILGIPVVLVFPGYAVSVACFPHHALGVPERVCLTLGLSLATTMVGGLLLNWTPIGLYKTTWLILLGAMTLVACGIAFVRRRRAGHTSADLPRIRLTLRSGLLLSVAALVLAGAFVISIRGAVDQENGQQATSLWMLPAGATGQGHAFEIGIRNVQPTTTAYELDVSVDGKPYEEWLSISLQPNEIWRESWTLAQSAGAQATYIEATLYLLPSQSTPYRHVELWLAPQT